MKKVLFAGPEGFVRSLLYGVEELGFEIVQCEGRFEPNIPDEDTAPNIGLVLIHYRATADDSAGDNFAPEYHLPILVELVRQRQPNAKIAVLGLGKDKYNAGPLWGAVSFDLRELERGLSEFLDFVQGALSETVIDGKLCARRISKEGMRA